MEKIHLFSREHSEKFPEWDNNKKYATICGYVRNKVTSDIKKVTCKQCLKEIGR